jgi:hypothetical protein
MVVYWLLWEIAPVCRATGFPEIVLACFAVIMPQVMEAPILSTAGRLGRCIPAWSGRCG